MRLKVVGVYLCSVLWTLSVFCSAVPPDPKSHGKEHYSANAAGGSEHNPNYDHSAFLGEEESKTFDQLSPEESKQRLGFLYDKIDADSDGYLTPDELGSWVHFVQNRYVTTDADRQWKELDMNDGEKLTWANYRKRTYGYMEDATAGKEPSNQLDGDYTYKNMIIRDERRWKKADQDGNGELTKDEFTDFLHPEEKELMRDIVIDETLEDIDKDHDGYISLAEYIGDMWPNKDEGAEPEWVKGERDQFGSVRDKDGDGRMDREEVRDWILPSDYDHIEAESKHLMASADSNKDGKLTKEEVISKYDVFVGSQATDFGEALMHHDEF